MRDDEIRRILTDSNPWWRAAAAGGDPTAWVADHRLLRDRAVHDLGFRSTALADLGRGPVTDILTVLTGPRRIGKSALAARTTSPLSITKVAAHLGFPGRPAFEARLRRLVSAFAAIRCERRDADRRVSGAQSKLYLTDPLLAWLPARLRAGLTVPDMAALSESVLAVTVARAIENLEEGRWTSGDTIAYARTLAGHEIDFAPVRVPSPAGAATTAPLEAKWVDQGWRAEARTISGKYGRGILATKSVLGTSGAVWSVPAPLVALLLT